MNSRDEENKIEIDMSSNKTQNYYFFFNPGSGSKRAIALI